MIDSQVLKASRTSKDEFLGHKILDLPEMRESYLVVPLSVEERLIVTYV